MNDLITIATEATIGPLRVGQTFSETLRILGNPEHLSFKNDMFDGRLIYGPVEVYVRINNDNVSSYLIQILLYKQKGRRLRINNEIAILRPKRSKLAYGHVRKAFVDAGVSFEKNSPAAVESGMYPLMQFSNNVRFYFSLRGRDQDLHLSYIELGNFVYGRDW